MADRPRRVKIHWERTRHLWRVVFSDHSEYFKRLVISAPLVAELSDDNPRAYLTGTVRLVRHKHYAEIVP